MDNDVYVNLEKMKEYHSHQTNCPSCKHTDIGQVDPPEGGTVTVRCLDCDEHWVEHLS